MAILIRSPRTGVSPALPAHHRKDPPSAGVKSDVRVGSQTVPCSPRRERGLSGPTFLKTGRISGEYALIGDRTSRGRFHPRPLDAGDPRLSALLLHDWEGGHLAGTYRRDSRWVPSRERPQRPPAKWTLALQDPSS